MKKLMLMLIVMLLCFGLCACGDSSKTDETGKSEEVKTEEKKKDDPYGLENGEYTVLEVRELFAHSHYSEYRELGLVLLDASGNRTYVRIEDAYEDNDAFDNLLTVLEGDVIKYKDGEFTIKK